MNLLKNYSCNYYSVYEDMFLTSILFVSLFLLYRMFYECFIYNIYHVKIIVVTMWLSMGKHVKK